MIHLLHQKSSKLQSQRQAFGQTPRSVRGSARVRTVRRLYIRALLQVSQNGFFGIWQSLCVTDMDSFNNSSSLPPASSSDSSATSGAGTGSEEPVAGSFPLSGFGAEDDDAGKR